MADRVAWLTILGQTCERYNWRIHAWCQMSNHYHLIIEMVEGNLSAYASSEILFVRQLNQLRKLPKRFQLWYGDQVTLKSELDSGRYGVRAFNVDTHNRRAKGGLRRQS